MASRETKRLRESLFKKKQAGEPKEKKIGALTIPSIIIIGLVLFGLLYFGGRGGSHDVPTISFASYDGRPVIWSSGNYFARKVGEVMELHRVDDESGIRLLLPYMIFHTAALIEAEHAGIAVSEKEIQDYILKIGAKDRYNKADSIERHDLHEIFKEELIELKLIETMIQSLDNKSLEDFAARMGLFEKKFRFVQWKYDAYPIQEAIKFASENPSLFKRIKLSRIAVKNEQEARDAYTKIAGNQSTFEEQLSQLMKIDSEEKAKLDWQSFYSLQSAIGGKEPVEKIFSLKQGEISDVVQIGSEWVIYRCDQEPVPPDLSSKNTIGEVKEYILEFEKGRVEKYFEEQAEAFLENARSAGLIPASLSSGLQVFQTDYFPLNLNGLPFLKKIPEIPGGESSLEEAQGDTVFFRQAFGLKKGNISDPVLLGSKAIILELVDERPASEGDLEKIRTDFKSFRDYYFKYFQMIIANRIYTRGVPQYYYGQMMYNIYGVALDQQQFYTAFIDPDKLGTRAEQDQRLEKGLQEYRKLKKQ